ncbi:hypothetical protein [Streptomyces sp. S.PB5]|uniref:hypothetical protein n=1 Tax=Streptomyces sp. S.PB5 TaxID=3020844 RepID=UPI0025B0BEE2|nr:hypothetical protein [Streptomyces sp. S.PB5]MDN3026068.1 hypothetical protein [Streptomyces sp. S.PB5]
MDLTTSLLRDIAITAGRDGEIVAMGRHLMQQSDENALQWMEVNAPPEVYGWGAAHKVQAVRLPQARAAISDARNATLRS